MAKLSTEELLEQFAGLTLVELSEFVKAFEEKFDVTAAAPSPLPAPLVALVPLRPRRRRTRSTSSSRLPATRRSRSSRRSASSPRWASARPRLSSTVLPRPSSRARTRRPPRRRRPLSKRPARRSPSSNSPLSLESSTTAPDAASGAVVVCAGLSPGGRGSSRGRRRSCVQVLPLSSPGPPCAA